MKFIIKTDEPSFFTEDTKELREKIKTAPIKSEIWDEYKEKRKLKEYILKHEQNGLCCYCESKVTLDGSHLEHIKPKSKDYYNLTFDYSNLAVSCNGKCYTDGGKSMTCGHKKDDSFDETKFLNPTTVPNIRDYFIYTEKGDIGSSSQDEQKSKYTLKLLQLNFYLSEARLKALKEFRSSIDNNVKRTRRNAKDIAKVLLEKENMAFISFLRFKYKKILQEQ